MDDHLATLAHAELSVSPPPEPPGEQPDRQSHKPPKSPPLAFEKTSNDSLAPVLPQHSRRDPSSLSPPIFDMGRLSSPSSSEADLRNVIDRQADAINKLHDAFAAERQVWRAERENMNRRIAALEQLLKTRDHHSPAKSPVMSPSVTSPYASAITNVKRLPSIAEDENILPLSQRREAAPKSLKLDPFVLAPEPRRESVVAFTEDSHGVKVEEVPLSPPTTAMPLSPVPPNYRANAGHTPLRIPSPPPTRAADGTVEDTPTRNNTHINAFLTKLNDEDEDKELKGPLNMPELPNRPDATNFTLEALSKRLERVAQSPDEEGRPGVFTHASPGLASPTERPEDVSPGTTLEHGVRGRREPTATQNGETSASDLSSQALSPQMMPKLSPQESHDRKVQHDFEQGGIKLKKKPSINFGQPLGQLSGFGRSMS